MNADATTGSRRPLTAGEIDTILTGITNAGDTAELLNNTLTNLYQALLSDTGSSLADFGDQQRLDPTAFAIPTSQWQAIVEAVVNRAGQWGTGPALSMQLVNWMPAAYSDPHTPAPAVKHPDRRPDLHQLRVTREAVDVITACWQRIQDLGDHFGWDSTHCLEASRSWHYVVAGIFAMNLGAETRISRDGPLSLLVTTGSGMVYGVIFHPTPRRCTINGCTAAIGDDGAVIGTFPQPGHREDHVPSYPTDVPQPGHWRVHS